MQVFTDASGEDRCISEVVRAQGSWKYTWMRVQQEIWESFLEREDNQIGVTEALAEVLAIASFYSSPPTPPIPHPMEREDTWCHEANAKNEEELGGRLARLARIDDAMASSVWRTSRPSVTWWLRALGRDRRGSGQKLSAST